MKRIWNPVTKFPSPGIKVIVRTESGEELEAIRPGYVSSYDHDPMYVDNSGNLITGVKEWAIK